jgi:hypothetical protein
VPPGGGLLDVTATFGFLAAATSTLRLGTGVALVPQRNPIYTAKEICTLDWLSGGRIDFGIGVGWNKEEVEACGYRWEDRRARRIEVMRRLWTEPVVDFETAARPCRSRTARRSSSVATRSRHRAPCSSAGWTAPIPLGGLTVTDSTRASPERVTRTVTTLTTTRLPRRLPPRLRLRPIPSGNRPKRPIRDADAAPSRFWVWRSFAPETSTPTPQPDALALGASARPSIAGHGHGKVVRLVVPAERQ